MPVIYGQSENTDATRHNIHRPRRPSSIKRWYLRIDIERHWGQEECDNWRKMNHYNVFCADFYMSFGLKQSSGGKEGYYLGRRKTDVGDEDGKEWSGWLFGQKKGLTTQTGDGRLRHHIQIWTHSVVEACSQTASFYSQSILVEPLDFSLGFFFLENRRSKLCSTLKITTEN